ncbi:MAG: hypothetical protein K5668_08795 [Lachnospiraceae bacterium]|nr:hypothetical protein [Lachnospiraceae bacterium]
MDEKNKVNLYNWQLYYFEGKYYLSGKAEYYPGYGRNVGIHGTSDILDLTVEEDVLRVETKHTFYSCLLRYMTVNPYINVDYEYVGELSHFADGSEDPLKKIIAVSAKIRIKNGGGKSGFPTIDNPKWEDIEPKAVEEDEFFRHVTGLQRTGQQELNKCKEEDDKRMLDILKKYGDGIYLEVANTENASKLAYLIGSESGIIEPSYHAETISDSILYTKYRDDKSDLYLDFRYFPRGWGISMETYCWTDNIDRVVILNEGKRTISFNDNQIQPGETKVFQRMSAPQ